MSVFSRDGDCFKTSTHRPSCLKRICNICISSYNRFTLGYAVPVYPATVISFTVDLNYEYLIWVVLISCLINLQSLKK